MRAIQQKIDQLTTEPVVTNAFRKMSGKVALGAAELVEMNRIDNMVNSLLVTKNDLLTDARLRASAAALGLKTVISQDETKVSTVFGIQVARLGSRKVCVAQIDDVVAKCRQLKSKLDVGTPVTAVKNDLQAARAETAAIASIVKKAWEPLMPKDTIGETVEKVEAFFAKRFK